MEENVYINSSFHYYHIEFVRLLVLSSSGKTLQSIGRLFLHSVTFSASLENLENILDGFYFHFGSLFAQKSKYPFSLLNIVFEPIYYNFLKFCIALGNYVGKNCQNLFFQVSLALPGQYPFILEICILSKFIVF